MKYGIIVVLAQLICVGLTSAQNQVNNRTINGTIVRIGEDRTSFSLVDRSGVVTVLKVSPGTTYQSNRVEVGFTEAVKFGMEVRCTPAGDGSVTNVDARGITSNLNVRQLQHFMSASEAEWAILQPKIERIEQLQRIAEGGGGGNNNGGNNARNNTASAAPQNQIRTIENALQSSFFDTRISSGQLISNLGALRDARARARADLASARRDLVELLTPRQEALLVLMEILE